VIQTVSSQGAAFDAWTMAQAAARAAASFDRSMPTQFALNAQGDLHAIGAARTEAISAAGGRAGLAAARPGMAVLAWRPGEGWESLLAPDDPRRDLLELYLPISSATAERPITIGHLGQSLDGFIATASGDSCYVTGEENILHLHRLRALCDAVVIGAGTVAADNPRLTTRLVAGTNPVRVILDPGVRLGAEHTVFRDCAAPTLRACLPGAGAAQARSRGEDVLEVAARGSALDLADLVRQLHGRGFCRIFVEGGGVTVSSFLEAGLLDRLQIAVAPLLIGEGRPAIRMPPQARLQDCLRLRHRVYRAGNDILFDCDLRAPPPERRGPPILQRIL